jgi:neopullulanase
MKKLLFIVAGLIAWQMVFSTGPELKRVEPMFWWVGMKDHGLQLLVYGKNISETNVNITYPGIVVRNVSSVANPNYLFIDLVISPETKPGKFDILFRQKGKTILTYSYELKEREKGSVLRKGFDNSDIIYLITPDRFANGNPANDTVPGMKEKPNRSDKDGRHGGDLRGVIQHLDYIKNMGFTSVWLTPVLENNMTRTSYHGYAITDFYKVDPRFGSNDEYLELSKELKKRGMKLIMDMVFNHCGSEHWWMGDMPMSDWINNYPDYKITTHQRTVNMDPHASGIDFQEMTEGWFVPVMPDLNQRNPYMATYLIQNSIWWIEYAGLAGIRQDTWPYSDKFMMAQWTKRILEEYPHFNIVGEEWSLNPAIISYWQKEKTNADGYVSFLPSLMDFPLQNAISTGLRNEETWNNGLSLIYESLANDFLYTHPDNLVIFPDNHDMQRFFTQLNEDVGLFKLGLTLFLTTRGIPQIFYGTEISMSSPGIKSDGIIRSDFPGGWQGDKANGFTGLGLSPRQKEVQDYIRKIANWRKDKEVIHSGKLKHFAPRDGTYVYFRYNENETVMVVLNKNKTEANLPAARFSEAMGNFNSGKDIITGKELSDIKEIKVPPLSAMIIELK